MSEVHLFFDPILTVQPSYEPSLGFHAPMLEGCKASATREPEKKVKHEGEWRTFLGVHGLIINQFKPVATGSIYPISGTWQDWY